MFMFKLKKGKLKGTIFYSRHLKPDFVYGLTDKEINDEYEIEEVKNDENK